jgi:hypothetical protein
MKKKIVILAGALALLATAGMGFASYQKADSGLSSLLLQNVEALAQKEISPFRWECFKTISTQNPYTGAETEDVYICQASSNNCPDNTTEVYEASNAGECLGGIL